MNRYHEIPQSIDLIKYAIENIPEGPVRVPVEIGTGFAEHRNEAPRGEVLYMAETNGNLIKHISIRTPSIMNIDSCENFMLKDVATVADAVSTYASCDPCIACAERVSILDTNTGETKIQDMF